MSRRQVEPLGVAIVTAWIEPGPPAVLKIRVSTRVDAIKHRYATKDPATASEYIRNWLESFRAESSAGADEESSGKAADPPPRGETGRRLVS